MSHRPRPVTRCFLRVLGLLAASCLLWLPPMAQAAQGAPEPAAAKAPEEARLAEAIRNGGVTILIRHSATDPGVWDPPGFDLADCATQRNLSDAGRDQARRIGRWFDANNLRPTTVRTSPWCRTRETAMLAFGRAEDWTPLSILSSERGRRAEQSQAEQPQVNPSQAVRAAIAQVPDGAIAVLVSHGVSISAFVDANLQQGEMVVVRRTGGAGIEILGRLLVP
jgi:phosphohistidine phosphatase SixA